MIKQGAEMRKLRMMIQTGLAGNIQHPPVQVTNNDESAEITEHPQSVESFEDETTDNIRIVPPIPTLNNDPNENQKVYLVLILMLLL